MTDVRETEMIADDHDGVKQIMEAEAIRDGYTQPHIDYIQSTVIEEITDEPDDDDFPTIDYP